MHPLYGAQTVPYVKMRVYAVLCTVLRLDDAEPRSTAGHLFPSQCPCGMILLTLYLMAWDLRVSRVFLTIGWYCGAGVFGLTVCRLLSHSLAPPTSFNKNNNNK